VRMIWPVAKRGRPRQRHVPDILSIPVEDMLANAKWRTISWRTGTKGKLKARFAAVRVRVADGPPQRIRDKGQQHLPGDEAWLIGEHRMSGEKKYYLANLPAKTDLRTLVSVRKHFESFESFVIQSGDLIRERHHRCGRRRTADVTTAANCDIRVT
jgi:SRSO17 transposase